MLDQFNLSFNCIAGIVLNVAYYVFPGADINPQELRKMYTEAQKRAEYIVQSGDMAELSKVEATLSKLASYQDEIEAAAPMIRAISAKLAEKGIIPDMEKMLPPL